MEKAEVRPAECRVGDETQGQNTICLRLSQDCTVILSM